MPLSIELEQEDDGRWIAEIPTLPGILVYGDTPAGAVARVQALGLRILADRVEPLPEVVAALFATAS